MFHARSVVCIGIAVTAVSSADANDGAYFMSGNQLVPIVETDISVVRERLALVRNGDQLDVSVTYEFENPSLARILTVGFEAAPPDGDVDPEPVEGRHPYMRAFTVEMNGVTMPYEVAIVPTEEYFADGAFRPADPETLGWEPHLYVYHFQAPFVEGRNTIAHSYSFDLSGSVMNAWSFDYVLTAANRWAGGRIGDFELILDMGSMVEVEVMKSFFANADEWQIEGIGAAYDRPGYYDIWSEQPDGLMFALREGHLAFRAADFRPAGELYLRSPRAMMAPSRKSLFTPAFDAARDPLPFALLWVIPTEAIDDFSARVLRNYLVARRGYVFRDTALATYFEQQPWYLPDPDYVPELTALGPEEQAWFTRLPRPATDP